MDIKVGDKFLCVSDFISVRDNITILFSKNKYYSVSRIDYSVSRIDNDIIYNKLYYLRGNNGNNYSYVLDDSSIYYIYNYFDTIRNIRLKKLNKFYNV